MSFRTAPRFLIPPPMPRASCIRSGIDFFPDPADPEYEAQCADAKAVCRGCPEFQTCKSWAIPNERFGIWGGMDEQERAKARKRLGIARQREPCGTEAAYKRHRAHGEEPCAPCRWANAAMSAEKKERHARNVMDAKKRSAAGG